MQKLMNFHLPYVLCPDALNASYEVPSWCVSTCMPKRLCCDITPNTHSLCTLVHRSNVHEHSPITFISATRRGDPNGETGGERASETAVDRRECWPDLDCHRPLRGGLGEPHLLWIKCPMIALPTSLAILPGPVEELGW